MVYGILVKIEFYKFCWAKIYSIWQLLSIKLYYHLWIKCFYIIILLWIVWLFKNPLFAIKALLESIFLSLSRTSQCASRKYYRSKQAQHFKAWFKWCFIILSMKSFCDKCEKRKKSHPSVNYRTIALNNNWTKLSFPSLQRKKWEMNYMEIFNTDMIWTFSWTTTKNASNIDVPNYDQLW